MPARWPGPWQGWLAGWAGWLGWLAGWLAGLAGLAGWLAQAARGRARFPSPASLAIASAAEYREEKTTLVTFWPGEGV